MNAQMAILDLRAKAVSVNKSVSSSKTSSKDEGTTFESVMKNVADDKKQISDKDSKKTYSQITAGSKAAGIKYISSVTDTKDTPKVTDETENTEQAAAVQSAADSVVSGIAVLLGIDTNSLKQLMAEMNIKTEDLLDSSKVNDIVQQLSVQLGLSSQQEQVLFDAVQQFTKLANQNVNNTAKADENWVVVEDVAIEVTKKDTNSAESLSSSHLDEDIRQLAASIKQTNSGLFDNVPQKFTSLLEQYTQKLEDSKFDEKKTEISEKKADIKEAQKEATAENGKAKTVINTKDDLIAAQTGDKLDDLSAYQKNDNVNNKAAIDDFAIKLNNVATQTRVVRNELMKQVVEQAKVLVDENRSEMVMQLKPDSLGKVTLKVVTENGIVAAKFVAENQQVKQVLEANMQTLKDSLEKQGMSVQNVSVSVGQDGSQDTSQREAFERRQRKNRDFNIEELTSVNGVDTEALTSNNPYEVSENSIDIIA